MRRSCDIWSQLFGPNAWSVRTSSGYRESSGSDSSRPPLARLAKLSSFCCEPGTAVVGVGSRVIFFCTVLRHVNIPPIASRSSAPSRSTDPGWSRLAVPAVPPARSGRRSGGHPLQLRRPPADFPSAQSSGHGQSSPICTESGHIGYLRL